jgi:ABC-2 type transport system permease protein
MTGTLVRKLLRDSRLALLIVGLLLGAFQALWAKITARILGELSPFFNKLAGLGGLNIEDVQDQLFKGPGQIVRTIIGGETIVLERAMDLMSIGYVHPLMQTIFCIWAIGRASGAIAGELDRGTMELLLAQPLARTRVILAHFCVDLITIPLLCLSLWAGTCLGVWAVGPIVPEVPEIKLPNATHVFELGPFKYKVQAPMLQEEEDPEEQHERLEVRVLDFVPALAVVAGLIFAVCGYTMWLSAAGRFRWRVLGLAVLITLLQFLVNVVGQMWDKLAVLRPFTIFYYYQPQQVILGQGWCVTLREWNGGRPLVQVPMLAVLFGVGLIGYGMALRTFTRRDLPAPL